MIHGAVGSGKELTARLIHKKSKRANGPFIVFSPTSMSVNKIQQELFGEANAQEKDNLFDKRLSVLEAANNGTLYIDEIGDLPALIQNKLLKFLKDQILMKSDDKSIKLDVRLVTSTTKDLNSDITQGRFRQDLYYRLNVMPLNVPILSDRKEDIPLLVKYFVRQLAKFSGLKEREFADEAIAALQAYNWPGNVRQLRNVIEWTLIMNPYSNGLEKIKSDMLPQEVISNSVNISKPDTNLDMMSMPLREAREVFERQYLSAQMNRFNNNISKTSTFVGMERSALHRKLKMLEIHTAAKILDKEKETYIEEIS
jgi:two-component system nitrogen regulation response regulator NtrX